ncbi:MAG: sugar transferase [Chloroflexi bacterium]|nr:sugar transferase [Chloroflexota bacterium]
MTDPINTFPMAGSHPAAARIRTMRLSLAERRILLRAVDLLLLNSALLLSVVWLGGYTVAAALAVGYLKWYVTLSLLWLIAANVLDLYNLARAASGTAIVGASALAALLTALAYLMIPWLTPPLANRSYGAGFVLLATAALAGWRAVYARGLSQPAFYRHALVVGAGPAARELLAELRAGATAKRPNPYRGTGYRIVGIVPLGGEGAGDLLPVLGEPAELAGLVRQHDVDEIILADPLAAQADPATFQALLDCRELGIPVHALSEVYERLTARLPVEYAHCDPALTLSPADSAGIRLYAAAKWLTDRVGGLVGLLALGLLAPIVALANALWSPGPLFYRQERLGLGGRPFAVRKFRTMIVDAERATGAAWATLGDPRITPVGVFLRKSRLDELPQVFNILAGEMSLVGPRPERPEFVGKLAAELPAYRIRHAVKPGITGWAQVRCDYGDSVEAARIKLEHDLYYVRHAGFYLDQLILLKTAAVVLGMRGR